MIISDQRFGETSLRCVSSVISFSCIRESEEESGRLQREVTFIW